jgi:LuxR family maltose regulon positive regulatory protein
MARAAQPLASDGQLAGAGVDPIAIGSPAWYEWLAAEGARAFTYRAEAGGFSARRERQRNGVYWYAYRRLAGRLRKAYLGRPADLTPERLAAVAASLEGAAPPQRRSRRRPQAPPPLPLLATKLLPPPPRPALLARPRLAARLDEALSRPLTLVVAPAGWGKTTLVSGWLRQRANVEGVKGKGAKATTQPDQSAASPATEHSPFAIRPSPPNAAWLSLDAADNDPARFWLYLAAALDMLLPGLAEDLAALRPALQPAAPVELAHAVAHALAGRLAPQAQLLLVLDDYHLLDDPAIHRGVALLLDHLPPWLHLLICARSEPPLPLSRLRARGQLAELRTDDLRFTPGESAAFVRDALGLALPPPALATLAERTEGWAAGLQLAALSWRSDEPGAPAADRYALDYLADEVLDQQPAPLRRFLLHTAVLDRMCAELCDAVLKSEDKGAGRSDNDGGFDLPPSIFMLQEIERANLFLVPLDGERRWYRYHHLFAEMLRERLRREAAALAPKLHRRAARWFHAQGLRDEAIGHALAAGDHALASELIEAALGDMLWVRGEMHTVGGWLRALPEALRLARPRIAAAYGWTLLATLRLAELQQLLASLAEPIARSGDAGSRGELLAIESFLMHLGGDPARALELARAALELLPPDRPTVRAMTGLNIANAHAALGDVRAVEAVAAELAGLATQMPGAIGALLASSAAAASLMMRARLPQALGLAERLLRQAADGGYRRNPAIGTALVEVALVRYEWNQLDAAQRALDEALELGRNWWNSDILINGYNLRGRLALARGDRGEAAQWFERADRLTVAYDTPAITQMVRDGEALWRLAVGDVAAAEAWELTCGLSLAGEPETGRYYGYLALARLSVLRGDAAAPLGLLAQLLARADAGEFAERALELLKLQALAYAALGDEEEALAALERALALAEPNGHVRAFVDEGAPMAALLRSARSLGIRGRYAARLLAAFPGALPGAGEALPEPLTPREAEVLRHLAGHQPLAEIAATLVVAPSTLRSHLKHLYAKLGAHGRLEALARARALGLLRDDAA